MELGLFISSLVAVAGTLVFALHRYVKYRKAIERVAQLEIDKITLSAKLANAYQDIENYKLGETEEFVQFLSKSRQWSFDFIEKFQQSLVELFEMLDKTPEDTQSILNKFIELKQYLPDEKITKEK